MGQDQVIARRLNVGDIIEVESEGVMVDAFVKSVLVNFAGSEFAQLELSGVDSGLPLTWRGPIDALMLKVGHKIKENCRSSANHQSALLI